MNTIRWSGWASGALLTCGALLLSACGAAGEDPATAVESGSAASDDWQIDAEYTAADGTTTTKAYEPLAPADITDDWRICAVFPHVKDALWVAANYGNQAEAERLGIGYNMYEAGGYTNLSTQLNQLDDCIVQKYDAIIIGAISGDGDCGGIEKALNAGIVVVDFINGTSCGEAVQSNPLFTRVAVSYDETAKMVGDYLVKEAGTTPRRVAVFPGPDGASFANDAVDGFNQAIKGSSVTTEVERRGDTGLDVQLDLITDVLQAYPDTTDIMGVDIAAEAATIALRNASKTGVNVYGYTIIPDLYQAILDGHATGAVADWTPYQGRIAVDQAVRALQKMDLGGTTVGPRPELITAENAKSAAYEDLFGPKGFKPVYEVQAAR